MWLSFQTLPETSFGIVYNLRHAVFVDFFRPRNVSSVIFNIESWFVSYAAIENNLFITSSVTHFPKITRFLGRLELKV